MNIRNTVLFISEELVTCSVEFVPNSKQYTFIAKKGEYQEGDYALCHVREQNKSDTPEYKTARVVEAHDECRIDVDSEIHYSFLVQKIDTSSKQAMEDKLNAEVLAMANSYRESVRASARKRLENAFLDGTAT